MRFSCRTRLRWNKTKVVPNEEALLVFTGGCFVGRNSSMFSSFIPDCACRLGLNSLRPNVFVTFNPFLSNSDLFMLLEAASSRTWCYSFRNAAELRESGLRNVIPVRNQLHDSDFTSSFQQLLFVLHKRGARTNCCIAL